MKTESLRCELSESDLISRIDSFALEQVAVAEYLEHMRKCDRFLKRARSIASVESFKADSKHELIYLQLLRAAENFGQGLMVCNEMDYKSISKAASPRNRLMEVFDQIASVNPNFFPLASEPSLRSADRPNKDQSSIRSALTRQGLLDLATKAEWLLFAQIPLGVNLFRLPKLTPEEWITRFGKLLGKHVLTMLNGSQYLITTNLNGSTTAQAMVGSNDLGKVS
jgi:hypothetical protein